jgi:protein-L-isoaspartate(D-aspartate) O-methyltransferase
MLEWHLARRGIRDASVLKAMGSVPRERFVRAHDRADAYSDRPLPIGDGQTISQPYIVALMVEAARIDPAGRVLEVGTGSGYAAAVLASIAAEVWSVERMPGLARAAAELLARLGYGNVTVVCADGSVGLAGQAPFDAIIVSACGPSVPAALCEQLADGGRLVMPVEERSGWQQLVRVTRHGDSWLSERLGSVRFVPLIGEAGWPPSGGEERRR